MSDFPESHRFLLDRPLATLATIGADGRPQLSEIVFLFDEDELRISLNNSRQKSKNLIANPKVTLMILDDSGYKYLEVRGDAKVEPDDDYAFGEKLMAKYPGLDLRALDGPGEKRLKVTIEPTRIREVDMTGGGD
jgi:PPOX class probable F420-dependent enzyme